MLCYSKCRNNSNKYINLEGEKIMSNSIQSMRTVFDIVKSSRDNNRQLSDGDIQKLLLVTVSDEKTRNRYDNFSKGYYAEELFRRVYSLLPWIKLITPLGQEQYPEVSKETIQVPDYEVTFEAGSNKNITKALIEVKLVDGEKETFELLKHTYEVLKKYKENSPYPLLFAIFWRKNMMWTINSIESFSVKSSSYKISFSQASKDDLSSIFGDYSYMFKRKVYRKSIFSNIENIESEYIHFHEEYGRTMYDSISIDGTKYDKLCLLETPVIDSILDFEQIELKKISEFETELIEQKKSRPYIYKLSSVMLEYLLKIYCYDNSDMYCKDNIVVQNTFGIVDTVRRKCGGEKYYLIPYNKNSTADNLMKIQFGTTHIFDYYCNSIRKDGGEKILCSHD